MRGEIGALQPCRGLLDVGMGGYRRARDEHLGRGELLLCRLQGRGRGLDAGLGVPQVLLGHRPRVGQSRAPGEIVPRPLELRLP